MISKIDTLDLMAYYNIDVILRGEEAMFSCPFHNDQDPSASINTTNGKWTCYRCKIGGNATELVSRLEHWTFKTADLWVRNRYGGFFKPASLAKEIERSLRLNEIKYYPEKILQGFHKPTKYWSKRGLSQESQEIFELGFDKITSRATIPIRDHEKRLVGVQGRATKSESFGKYLFLYNLSKKQHLYGIHLIEHSDWVVVVEGVVPTIRLMSMGIPCVSVMGSVVSEEQAVHLNTFSKVYMLFDNDEAGWTGMIGPPDRPRSRLAAWKKISTKVYIPTNEDYNDLDELGKDEIMDILRTSKNAHVNIPLVMSSHFSA